MTDDTDQTTTASEDAVRIPNVRPKAISGLDHELLNPGAAASSEAAALPPNNPGLLVPAGDLDSRLEWVAAAPDASEASLRADAIYEHEKAVNDGEIDLDVLAAILHTTVYRIPGKDGAASEPRARTPDDGPLPVIENDGTGTPLDPPAPEPTTADPDAASTADPAHAAGETEETPGTPQEDGAATAVDGAVEGDQAGPAPDTEPI